jgi:hypothetical protein
MMASHSMTAHHVAARIHVASGAVASLRFSTRRF